MDNQDFLFQAMIFLLAAVVSVPVAKRLGLGSALGYLLAGVIIGPYVLGLVGEEGTDIMHFAEIGVVMMLFLVGLELKPSLLWTMRREIFGLGGLQLLFTTLAVGGISLFLGMNLAQSVTIGLIFSLSSTAIILQTLTEKKLLKSPAGKNSVSVLLFQDIAVIPILAILPLFANQIPAGEGMHLLEDPHGTGVSGLAGWQQLLLIIGVVAFIIMGGRFLARYVFRYIANTNLREIFTAAALLMIIGIAVGMTSVGLSPALGTFLAGVVLADNEYRHELETDIEPFKGLLLGLFFIAVGASINFQILFRQPWMVLGLVGMLIAVKFIILWVLGRFFGLRSGQDLLFSFALAQTGEFAFLLLSFSSQNAILTDETSGILLIVVAISMMTTPVLLILNDLLIQPVFQKKKPDEDSDTIDEQDNPVIIAGYGRFGVVLGRFLKANGIGATILDNNPDNIRVLRKFGFKVYYGDATRPDLLAKAGAARARILVVALDDPLQINGIIEQVQKKFPHLRVFSRARDVRHSFQLEDMAIAGYRRDTYDASLELGVQVLSDLGYKRYQASRAARIFRYHDRIVMDELQKMWKGDRKKYITQVRRFTEQLETILMAEQDYSVHESDHAWDVDSRREEAMDQPGPGKRE
jgi:glutathione-regulated potassium-efflux system ancillary protein KefC